VSATDLPEVTEAEATGSVAAVYDEIRTAVGLPMVNLIYRTLAAEPGRLESVWAELAPNLLDASMDERAARLVSIADTVEQRRLHEAAVAAIGVGEGGLDTILGTIDAYQHANPRNLVVLSALLSGAYGDGSGGRPAGPPRTFALLPMAALGELSPTTRHLLDTMSAPLVAPGEQVLVPSLLRHFAHNPALLALLWTVTAPAVYAEGFARAAAAVESEARSLAGTLPHEVTRLPQGGTRALVARFTQTIARMVVYASLMRRALSA
jgi:hypothetical protein